MKNILTKSISKFSLICLLGGLSSHVLAAEIAFESDSTIPVVYLNVALKSGAVTDPKGKSGLTNFMGEMLLRGTKVRTKEQLDLALDQMGAQLAVETRAEAMIIRGAVLSTQIDPFLKLLNEVVTQPSFPEVEMRKLKNEITSELLEELGNDGSLANRRFYQHLFEKHPYGNPILGKSKEVEGIKRAEVQKHYDTWVKESVLLVVGSGDASQEKIAGWTQTLSKGIQGNAPQQTPASLTQPEQSKKQRLIIVDKPERTQTQINGGQIGVKMTDPDFFPLYLGNFAFGGGSFSARMMVEIRVKRGWSYGANSYFRHGLQPRSWQFHLFPAEKYTPEALSYSLQMVKDLSEKGISNDEFQFAQESLVKSSGFMYNTPKKRVENTLLEKTLNLPSGFMKSYGSELQKLNLTQVNAALKKFLKPQNQTLVVVGTAKNLKEKLAKSVGMKPEQVEVIPYTQD